MPDFARTHAIFQKSEKCHFQSDELRKQNFWLSSHSDQCLTLTIESDFDQNDLTVAFIWP